MKTLNTQAFEEIRRWIFRNARPLDLALWQYHFETGSREAILAILSHYQNRDGGFGYAIEPDNWNPASTPYNAHFVVRILRMIDFLDTTHPIYQGIFRYLEHTTDQADYGWFFIIPSNNHYPHAVWWDYNPEKNIFQSIGITAILSGFILRYGDKQSNLYKIATEYAKTLIEKLPTTTNFGDMGLKGYSELLDDIEAAGLREDFNCQYLREKLQDLVWSKIHDEKDNFMANPLEFIFSPNSRFYEKNQLEVEAALDQLIDQRPASGVWDIPWEWYNGNQYAKAFAISENWWKSFQAIEKLLQLKRFGRLSL
ncbi:hypothetical protein EDC14_102182 [Hydrogenispora ethanolica]|uniref:Prenyltransferase/squalene oxidase-like repeat protein n=1 Tax=Hydrogenispora ethanolica TaxID=1082276 RepID=A0A4R1RC14_HYDET|nr:hypothetical protein [Hydrogenispora ethanolica]TCL63364.1 hypothetical protein EDC14_102182 [Hydrogenispora ethanolica]